MPHEDFSNLLGSDPRRRPLADRAAKATVIMYEDKDGCDPAPDRSTTEGIIPMEPVSSARFTPGNARCGWSDPGDPRSKGLGPSCQFVLNKPPNPSDYIAH